MDWNNLEFEKDGFVQNNVRLLNEIRYVLVVRNYEIELYSLCSICWC